MQAGLDTTRNRWQIPALFLVLAMALILGGTIGYLVKPASLIPGPVRVFVVPAGSAGTSSGDACIFVNHHKGC